MNITCWVYSVLGPYTHMASHGDFKFLVSAAFFNLNFDIGSIVNEGESGELSTLHYVAELLAYFGYFVILPDYVFSNKVAVII